MSSEWKDLTLGEIAEINMGQSPESKYYNFNELGLPFLQGNRTFEAKYSSLLTDVFLFFKVPILGGSNSNILLSSSMRHFATMPYLW